MGLYIYQAYTKLRGKHVDTKIMNNLNEKDVNVHKAKIVMDMILQYIHQGDRKDEDIDIDIGNKPMVEFMWRIQSKIPKEVEDKRVTKNYKSSHKKKKQIDELMEIIDKVTEDRLKT